MPFAVGGGVRSIDDMLDVLDAGAEKVSVDSMAVRNPEIISARRGGVRSPGRAAEHAGEAARGVARNCRAATRS